MSRRRKILIRLLRRLEKRRRRKPARVYLFPLGSITVTLNGVPLHDVTSIRYTERR